MLDYGRRAEVRPDGPVPAAATLRRNRNSFDTLRLVAATMVFVSHFLGMAGLGEPHVAPLQATLGSAGVYIFFAMSGFLVTDSVMRGASLPFYTASRVLRVYPGLLACLTVCVLFGAMVTTVGRTAYWHSTETHLFMLGNLFPLGLPAFITLPGVFEGARWPAVNGSLWTIKYELTCYAALAAVYLASARHRRAVAALILTIGLLVMIAGMRSYDPAARESYVEFELASFLRLATPFFVAGLLRAYLTVPRARLIYPATALAVLYAVLLPFGGSMIVAVALLSVMTIGVGSSSYLRIPALGRVGDLSYGIYLYAYPVSNLATIALLPRWGVASTMGLAATTIVGLSFLSWTIVEKPTLALKARVPRHR